MAAVDAQIAALEHDRAEATISRADRPASSTSRLVEPGELVAVGAPLVVIVDLDHAWANAYVEEPLVPALRIDQAATVVTDAGDRLAGPHRRSSRRAPSSRRATSRRPSERAKLVYRVKVTVDNRQGVLKPGMPVEVELASAGRQGGRP